MQSLALVTSMLKADALILLPKEVRYSILKYPNNLKNHYS